VLQPPLLTCPLLDAACGGALDRVLERRGVRPPPPRPIFLGGLHHVVAVRLGSVLRQGGWRDTEVTEMVEVAAYGVFDGEEAAAPPAADPDAVLDALLLKADRCSDSLRRAGWSSEDVSDALGLDLRRCKERPRPAVRIPPEIAIKVERLAKSVARC